MKSKRKILVIVIALAYLGLEEATAQWAANGNHIYNTNTDNVGIGTNAPATLLYVAKNMTEPNITVRNLGGTGGATYTMTDDASGANWKFKATFSGGFKIRDHANTMDVIVIEPGSFANALCIKNTNNIGIGTNSPETSALIDMTSTTKGFLMPRMTQSQIEGLVGPANGLLVFCTTDNKFYGYIAIETTWKEILLGTGTIVPE